MREQSRPEDELSDDEVFMRGVGAVADGAEPVERRDAERGGEIAIRAAADGGFRER